MAGSTDWRLVAGFDDRGDRTQEPQIHRSCPCLLPQIWAATAQDRHSGQLNPHKEEIGELITHLAFYAGWPAAMTAALVAKDVFEKNP